MNAEEMAAFAAAQIRPCHFRLRVGGLMRTDESEPDGRIHSHTPFAVPLFIWSLMGLICGS